MKTNTIQFKIGILYVGILGLILLAYSLIVVGVLERTLAKDIDKRLETKTHEIARLMNTLVQIRLSPSVYHITALNAASHRIVELHRMSYANTQINALEEEVLEMMDRYDLHDDYFSIIDAEGRLISGSQNTPPELTKILLGKIIAHLKHGEHFSTVEFRSKKIRLITTRAQLPHGPSYFIQIASSLVPVKRVSQKLFYAFVIILPVMLVLASFTGRFLILKILKPVQVVTKAAESITHEDLSHRVQFEHIDEEMQELVQAFNRMIDRLEKAFSHISEFSMHVAHELKTPLAVIRGESELALRKDRNSAEYREALEANLREAERMIRIIEDMLLLARLDYDPQSLHFTNLDLVHFMKDIVEKTRILAEKKSIGVSAQFPQEKITVYADEIHLRRLFFNILENAIKFTPAFGSIALELLKENNIARIKISDSGPGISETDLRLIFDKFFHKDQSGGGSGNGLGLSIALSIARAHQGDIGVTSPRGRGSIFTVTLPTQS